ncbi:Hpt domain-containing protein [Devosia rhizoryzae]|uniref:Hpt domain-containing protein n=1 Tax=Devosia rhizoryzae TaxID=2774137 RepID=A0ABX7C7K6_9HYPH|nr:Hpt domain-containing protein [Devosia rhizoryzae]QQR40248.1 Hpt domain-containing protein [Devosia rhizoryzae]
MAERALAQDAVPVDAKRPMRPIDLVHLAKQCLGDENLELEVLRLFETTLKTYYERLTLATAFDDLAINLHSIKGAAAGVGAWAIADQAKAMEAEMRDGRPLRAERIADLGIAVEEVRDFISRMLADEAA